MPWKDADAKRFTHKANTPKKRQVWAKVSNSALKRGLSDKDAIREANAAVGRIKNKR